MEKHVQFLVAEIAIPSVINVLVSSTLIYRICRLVQARLLYNVEIPPIITFKKIVLYLWIAITLAQITFLWIKNPSTNKYFWIQ